MRPRWGSGTVKAGVAVNASLLILDGRLAFVIVLFMFAWNLVFLLSGAAESKGRRNKVLDERKMASSPA